jgi:prevent-host-death family protein
MEVGVRELKAKLSEYLGRAAAGEELVVTDRGRPVARLVPLDVDDPIARGIEDGWIDPPRRAGLESVVRHPASVATLDVLDEDRG